MTMAMTMAIAVAMAMAMGVSWANAKGMREGGRRWKRGIPGDLREGLGARAGPGGRGSPWEWEWEWEWEAGRLQGIAQEG